MTSEISSESSLNSRSSLSDSFLSESSSVLEDRKFPFFENIKNTYLKENAKRANKEKFISIALISTVATSIIASAFLLTFLIPNPLQNLSIIILTNENPSFLKALQITIPIISGISVFTIIVVPCMTIINIRKKLSDKSDMELIESEESSFNFIVDEIVDEMEKSNEFITLGQFNKMLNKLKDFIKEDNFENIILQKLIEKDVLEMKSDQPSFFYYILKENITKEALKDAFLEVLYENQLLSI